LDCSFGVLLCGGILCGSLDIYCFFWGCSQLLILYTFLWFINQLIFPTFIFWYMFPMFESCLKHLQNVIWFSSNEKNFAFFYGKKNIMVFFTSGKGSILVKVVPRAMVSPWGSGQTYSCTQRDCIKWSHDSYT